MLHNKISLCSRQVNINASSNRSPINKDFPSLQFNHVILCVPLATDTIWLENTASYLPFNYLGTFTQNRQGLLVNGIKSQLVKTPKLTMADVACTNTSVYNFNNMGKGNLILIKPIEPLAQVNL